MKADFPKDRLFDIDRPVPINHFLPSRRKALIILVLCICAGLLGYHLGLPT